MTSSIAENGAMGQPAAEPKRGALGKRVLSAAILVPVVLVLVVLGGWYFTCLVAVVAALLLFEWLHILFKPRMPLTLVACAAVAAAVLSVGAQAPAVAVGFAVGSAVVAWFAALGQRRRWWIPIGLIWFVLPCVALVWLRDAGHGGLPAVLWTLLVIWSADTAAYFAGKGIGGPKLAPRVSPNKTWAGLLGGMAGAALVSVAFAAVIGGEAFVFAAVAAAVLAPWSQIGDLAESAIKRYAGVKDSGTMIPGHGGVFDRVDALLFVAPVVALMAAIWPEGDLPWL